MQVSVEQSWLCAKLAIVIAVPRWRLPMEATVLSRYLIDVWLEHWNALQTANTNPNTTYLSIYASCDRFFES